MDDLLSSVLASYRCQSLCFGYILVEWPVTDSHHRALTSLTLNHRISTSLPLTLQRRSKHLCCFWCKRKFHLLLLQAFLF